MSTFAAVADAFRELARVLRVVGVGGRRVLRYELERRHAMYPVGASWERRDGTMAKPAPHHAPMPADWKSGLRCRSILQPHAFFEADAMDEYRKLRNERKRERRALR